MKEIIIINTSILDKGPWRGFENNFEENTWKGDPNVYCLADYEHHIAAAAYAAKQLSQQYKSEDEIWVKHKIKAQPIIQQAYYEAAEYLYPDEKLYSGIESPQPEFWAIRNNTKLS